MKVREQFIYINVNDVTLCFAFDGTRYNKYGSANTSEFMDTQKLWAQKGSSLENYITVDSFVHLNGEFLFFQRFVVIFNLFSCTEFNVLYL